MPVVSSSSLSPVVAKQGWKDTAITLGRKAGAVVVFATILPAVAKAIHTFAASWNDKTKFAEGVEFSKGFNKENLKGALRKIGQVAARLFGLSTALEFLSRKPAKAFDWAREQFNTKVVREEVKALGPKEDKLEPVPSARPSASIHEGGEGGAKEY